MNLQRTLTLLLSITLSAGCISHRAVSARRALVEAARTDATNARAEYLSLAKQDLATHSQRAIADLERSFDKAVRGQHEAGNATPERIGDWAKAYARSRDEIRVKLMRRAEGLTATLRKIESGGEALASLERMEVNAEDARRQFMLGYKALSVGPREMIETAVDNEMAALIDELLSIRTGEPAK